MASGAPIRSVKTTIVGLPLDVPYEGTPLGPITSITSLLLEIATEGGVEAFGQIALYNPRSAAQIKSVRALVDDLGEWLIGQDGLRRGAIQDGLRRLTMEALQEGIAKQAQSVIDLALWDLAGKHFGVPVSLLLGGRRDKLDVYESGRLTKPALADLVREAEGIAAQGFRAAKISAGARSLKDDVARIEAVRCKLGPGFCLMVDCGRRLSPNAAVQFARAIAPLDIHWLEDPVAQADIAGHRWVREHGGVPVATGERISGFAELDALLSAGAVDHVMLNVHRVGGPSAWLSLAQAVAHRNVPLSTHGGHEFQRHLLASQAHGHFVEFHSWWNGLYANPPAPSAGMLEIGSEPGFGLVLDRESIARRRLG